MRKLTHPVVNWRPAPFVRLLFPFALGSYLAYQFNQQHYLLLVLFVLSVVGYIYLEKFQTHPSRRWCTGICLHLFLFLLGYQLGYFNNDLNRAKHFQQTLRSENVVVGIVDEIPVVNQKYTKAVLKIQGIGETATTIEDCQGKLLVLLKVDSTDDVVPAYGDKIVLKGRITTIATSKNPHAFDFKQYLFFKNIHHQSFVNSTQWSIVASHQGNAFLQWIYTWRHQFQSVLTKYITGDEERSIATALLLGDKTQLSDKTKNAYAQSGAIHVLAVSGLHVGILSGLFLLFLRRLPFSGQHWRGMKLLIILFTIWSFALLTGGAASVVRASCMFTIFYIGSHLQRQSNSYNSLAIAAFLLLLYNPFALFDVGFQLSFSAVLAIIFLYPRLHQIWVPSSKVAYYFWTLTLVSLCAQIGVAPLSLYYFHQVPTYFWLTGLVVIPVASIILYGGIFLLISDFFCTTLASLLGKLLDQIIYLQNEFVKAIQHLPFHCVDGFWLQQWEVVCSYLVLISVGIWLFCHRYSYLFVALSGLLFLSCSQLLTYFWQTSQRQIIVYAIPAKSAIDFVDGKKVYEYQLTALTEKDHQYNRQNHRWAKGISTVVSAAKEGAQQAHFYKKGNFMQFHNIRLATIDKGIDLRQSNAKPFRCDYIILQGEAEQSIEQLKEHFNFKKLIFDTSCPAWKVSKWIAECEKLNIDYTDIRTEGALIISLI
ncbi:MAG: ComEC/Rec2 family competence protein [Bacteroidota bacterium]